MSLLLLIGGARSGKSRLAVDLVARWRRPVVFIATGQPRDEEMSARIARHRAQRPEDWTTVEEAIDLEKALSVAAPEASVVVDCLTLWVSNLIERGNPDDDILDQAGKTAQIATGRPAGVVAVTNEVGSGVIPSGSLGRRFRDLLGSVNSVWAEAADRTAFVVAGRVLPLQGAEVLSDG